ncbi:MAG: 3-dehydroquinate synthase [Bacillales bacterium]|jgi:3-dehydroquinate synthase|nr:3-dehydroquinate synthase [Bacillales bacterium]
MKELVIQTSSKSYPVYVGDNGISALSYFCKLKMNQSNPILLITDRNIPNNYVDDVVSCLRSEGFNVSVFKVPSGEGAKQFEVYQECITFCIKKELNRQSLIIAFGGGVVGDLAGFVAATYLRGVRYLQMPTTLLAHDSAIGGKVAINHPLGKNLIGAFHQPETVIFHLPFLDTLPERELLSGFAEIIKEALIGDAKLLKNIMLEVGKIKDIHTSSLEDWICSAMKVKSKIVAEDEKENGVRAFLNFGHTLGHAIEGAQKINSRSHGECVAIGVLFALRLSMELTRLHFDITEFENWLKSLGYLKLQKDEFTKHELIEFLKRDKKVQNGKVDFVLLQKIGKPMIKELDFDYLEDKIGEFLDEIGFYES